uniref:Uncharacterized protein n=1 Tax=Macrostomum lignano TaxID=282301 RepID=A0A1I8FFI4_9PLAT
MFDTGMTNWRHQSFCLPRIHCRSSLNKDILDHDKTKGLIVVSKWDDGAPKEVKEEDFDEEVAVLCTAMTCPSPHSDDQLTERHLVSASWNSSLSAAELQLKKLPFHHIEYTCAPNFVCSSVPSKIQ